MNQRIFELAKQADLIQWDTLPSGARTPIYESVVKAKKFSEMIIRKCAEVNYNSPFQDGEFHAREVLEYFGVEE